jgi:hypothetical protein
MFPVGNRACFRAWKDVLVHLDKNQVITIVMFACEKGVAEFDLLRERIRF